MSASDSDEVWRRAEIESPCIKMCMIHPTARICVGCYRTGDEIARWSRMSAQDRKAVLDSLPARAADLTQRGAVSRRRRTTDTGKK
ncbi:MAG: DUF1289 domain-containing protein [Pseudomonadota bacterium]